MVLLKNTLKTYQLFTSVPKLREHSLMSRHLLAFDRNKEKLRDNVDILFLLLNLERTERSCVFVNFNLELYTIYSPRVERNTKLTQTQFN